MNVKALASNLVKGSETERVVKMSHNAGHFSIWGLVNCCVFAGGGACFSIFLWSVNQKSGPKIESLGGISRAARGVIH